MVVGNQSSSNPSTSYAPPSVDAVISDVDTAALPTDGGTVVFLVGSNFGPSDEGVVFLESVTYGTHSVGI
jgi:hypothetical protein